MLAVIGSFRFPPDRVAQAVPLMQQVIAETLAEPGCHAYSYAQEVAQPGLFRVMEMWSDRAALDAHFASSHMVRWSAERLALGFHDRQISVYPIGAPDEI